MKISYSWLKEYIDVDLPVVEAGDLLTDTGLEVEGVETFETVKGGLKGVVVGEVLTCKQHPNADRLKVTTVNIGEEETLHIVCGAPNVSQGQKVLVATIGTVLYTKDGENFKIKKGKIRGEVSQGMICAEDELGLGQSHDGIMVLDVEAEVGIPAAEYLNIKEDQVIEIGLTPNRTDAMGHIGVARDLSAALLRKEIKTTLKTPSITTFIVNRKTLKIPIEVENENACGHYLGLTISGVNVGESPDWLKHRLLAIGINPTNNVVDATNYVLHETGHPLHSFDADDISGGKIIVRNAFEGEKFITLDGKERDLHPDDLMICNVKESMCIAGVLGGAKSGVNERTKNIFLEAAWFDPVSIRKTARRHGLNTDASFRYERGVDPRMTEYALKRVAMLIENIAGGEISSDIQKVENRQFKEVEIDMSFDRINRLIGQEISKEDVHSILYSLEIKVVAEGADNFRVRVPLYRADVTREADIIEEILRIYGLNNIDLPGNISFTMHNIDTKSSTQLRKKVNDFMTSKGYTEIQNNSLTKEEYYQSDDLFPESGKVSILNPLSNDLGVMRQTMMFGGLEVIHRNINHKNSDLKLIEFGKTYHKIEGNYTEHEWVSLWVTGNEQLENWKLNSGATDFYSLKNDVTNLLKSYGIQTWMEESFTNDLVGEGLLFKVGEKVIVSIGTVSNKTLADFSISQPVYTAEINWAVFMKRHYKTKVYFQEIPKYPAVRRDLALLVDTDVRYRDLRDLGLNSTKRILKEVNLFDVYEGKNLPSGKKSYGLSFVFQDPTKTLTDKQVDGVMNRLIKVYKDQFSAELR